MPGQAADADIQEAAKGQPKQYGKDGDKHRHVVRQYMDAQADPCARFSDNCSKSQAKAYVKVKL